MEGAEKGPQEDGGVDVTVTGSNRSPRKRQPVRQPAAAPGMMQEAALGVALCLCPWRANSAESQA